MDPNQTDTSNRLWRAFGKPNLNQGLLIVLVAVAVGVAALAAAAIVLAG
jgi:hypothetical protein